MFTREIHFESILNFRDLGGYQGARGRKVAWGHLFRCAELHRMTGSDVTRFKEEIKLASVIDLRSAGDGRRQKQEIAVLNDVGAAYHYVPFVQDPAQEMELYARCSNMGEVYSFRLKRPEFGSRLVEAIEIIARPESHPLAMHCAVGKDRTGVLAAIVLSTLGVSDADIAGDYAISAPYMKVFLQRLNADPEVPDDVKNLPGYTWEATAESMLLFLSSLRRDYGSARKYLELHGASPSLCEQLEVALLE